MCLLLPFSPLHHMVSYPFCAFKTLWFVENLDCVCSHGAQRSCFHTWRKLKASGICMILPWKWPWVLWGSSESHCMGQKLQEEQNRKLNCVLGEWAKSSFLLTHLEMTKVSLCHQMEDQSPPVKYQKGFTPCQLSLQGAMPFKREYWAEGATEKVTITVAKRKLHKETDLNSLGHDLRHRWYATEISCQTCVIVFPHK